MTPEKIEHLKLFNEMTRTLVTLVASIAILIIVQIPNNRMSADIAAEDKKRERARLIVDIMKYDDPKSKSLALSVVNSIYGESEDFIELLSKVLAAEGGIDRVSEATSRLTADDSGECRTLQQNLDDIMIELEALNREAELELRGAGGRVPGAGPVYTAIQASIALKRDQSARIQEALINICGVSE